MRCQDIMNLSVQTCSPDDSIKTCADLVRARSLPMLAVIDHDQIVGVLGRKALLSASWQHAGRARDVMSTDLVFCRPDDSVDHAARLLVRSGAPVIFVVDGGEAVGWLGARDLKSFRADRPRMFSSRRVVQ